MDHRSQLLCRSLEQLQLKWLVSGEGCVELLLPARPGCWSVLASSPVTLPAGTAQLQAPACPLGGGLAGLPEVRLPQGAEQASLLTSLTAEADGDPARSSLSYRSASCLALPGLTFGCSHTVLLLCLCE